MTKQPTVSPIGILGGTFDPIHLGHTQPVKQVAYELGITKVRLLPCHIPPHKQQPYSNSQHRLAMVSEVCRTDPFFVVDDFELNRDVPSYSVNTLAQMRKRFPEHPLCFFIGMDSLINFCSWYQWQQILSLCHLIVNPRPGFEQSSVPKEIAHLLTTHPADIQQTLGGHIYISTVQQYDVSSTNIRKELASGIANQEYLHPSVQNYIHQHKLYSSC